MRLAVSSGRRYAALNQYLFQFTKTGFISVRQTKKHCHADGFPVACGVGSRFWRPVHAGRLVCTTEQTGLDATQPGFSSCLADTVFDHCRRRLAGLVCRGLEHDKNGIHGLFSATAAECCLVMAVFWSAKPVAGFAGYPRVAGHNRAQYPVVLPGQAAGWLVTRTLLALGTLCSYAKHRHRHFELSHVSC